MATADDPRSWASRSTGSQRLVRGMRGRCPRCGGGGLAASFFELEDACPTCSWTFEREEGYWVGAMVVLMAVVLGSFALFLGVGIIAFWPDVHWTGLVYGGLGLNLIVPIVFYRWSKTTWMGLHTAFVPSELEHDIAGRTGV